MLDPTKKYVYPFQMNNALRGVSEALTQIGGWIVIGVAYFWMCT